jgi:hypothetical protein
LIYWRKPNVHAHFNPRKSRAKTISIQEVGGFDSFAASAQQIVDLLEGFPTGDHVHYVNANFHH